MSSIEGNSSFICQGRRMKSDCGEHCPMWGQCGIYNYWNANGCVGWPLPEKEEEANEKVGVPEKKSNR